MRKHHTRLAGLGQSLFQRQKVEILDEETAEWLSGHIEKLAVDGRTFIRFDEGQGSAQWVDLTKCRYRWIVESGRSSASLLETPA